MIDEIFCVVFVCVCVFLFVCLCLYAKVGAIDM
jgi:hypothetical protein